jgi:4-carboxymuconolactone decarboxylase
MTMSKKAQENHDELLPNYKSTLKVTDPELIELYDNFAFDEVLEYGNLDKRTRLMVVLAALIANQTLTEFKIMLSGALNIGVTPIEGKEIVYQSIPYVGIAKAVDFLNATNEIFKERGIELPLEGQSTTTPENRVEKGLELSKSVFGEMIDKMYETSPKNQIHIQKYLSGYCFGDFYTRKGLDIKIRELLTFSMLISLGDTAGQIKGHIQGNLNVGNNKDTLLSVITQCMPYNGFPRTLNALNYLNEIVPE